MTKQKIYLNGRFLGQTLTGVQRYALEVIKAFDQLIEENIISAQNYEFTLIVPSQVSTDLSFKHIQLKKVGLFNGQLWEQLTLPFFTFDGLLINLCNTAPIIKANQVVTIHDASASANKENYSYAFRTWYQILHRILPFRVKQIFTDSEFSKNELMHYYPIQAQQIEVIHLGLDHLWELEEDSSILKKNQLQNKKYILGVSSLNPNKNFKALIEAFALIGDKEIKMVIVGNKDNPIYNDTGLQQSNRIQFLGYVTDEQLKSLYKHAKMFVFPSFYEGFGLPPVEAMLFGCPVIASNVASLPEVLEDAALYCDPSNSASIVEKIDELILNESLANELIQKGFEQSAKYNWSNCARKLFQITEEVIKK